MYRELIDWDGDINLFHRKAKHNIKELRETSSAKVMATWTLASFSA